MELPIGITAYNGSQKVNVVKLNISIYGLKQAYLNWFNLLSGALKNKGRNSKPSQADSCFFLSDCVVLIYVDGVLIIAKSKGVINNLVKSLEKVEEKS